MVVVPLDAGWSDVVSWSALYDISTKDSNGNVIKGDAVVKDTTNTYVNLSHHAVAAVGLENFIVIDTAEATLIASRDKVHEVKSIV